MKSRFAKYDVYPITVTLPLLPFSPWVRFGMVDITTPERAQQTARVRVLRDFEFILQLHGVSWIWSEALGGSIDIRPGDLVFLPPGFVHGWAYTAESHLALHFDLHANPSLALSAETIRVGDAWQQLRMIEFHDRYVHRHPVRTMPMFSLHWNYGGNAQHIRIPLITPLEHPTLWYQRMEALVNHWQTNRLCLLSAQLQAMETLSWALSELAHAEDAQIRAHSHVDPRILALLQELNDPISSQQLIRLTVAELAQHTGIGLTLFRRLFRAATRQSPHHYLEEWRIERAAHALAHTDLPIHEIARAVGYEDPYHFSRVFRCLTSLSPLHYRKTLVEPARRTDSGHGKV